MSFSPFLNKYRVFSLSLLIAVSVCIGLGQTPPEPKFKSQEISEADGYPVLMKNLPDFDIVKDQAKFAVNSEQLLSIGDGKPVLANVDMSAGAEATAANYAAGKLVMIEFPSPQASIEADQQLTGQLSGDSSTIYRRIGNYNALVFNVTDPIAANALLDQVKYEKNIQWLGENPFRISAERAFVIQTSELFVSTVIWIFMGIGLAVLVGLAAGFVFFRVRERERAGEVAFANLSGMTTLELDAFTSSDRTLHD
ncbi:MAG TPA: hypothetical protein PKA82_09145 [Pyrinomonadaceae bacterium]|nr:hypothetical protein [Pyrinomonadaceae bacterium]